MSRSWAYRHSWRIASAIPLLLLLACSGQEPPYTAADGALVARRASLSDTARPPINPDPVTPLIPAGRVVDSIVPPEVALERFREGLPPTDALSGGAPSIPALGDSLIQALERSDTLAIRALVLDRAEFAYLYYPHTEYLRPPRGQSPALLWLFISENSEKGATRMVRRLAGHPLDYQGVSCPEPPRVEGPNQLWVGCTVALGDGQGAVAEGRLFGSILARDGRFKFVSYANDF